MSGSCAAIIKLNPEDNQVKLSVGRHSIQLPEELTEEINKLINSVPHLNVDHVMQLKEIWDIT